ncbi:MAG: DUF4390 domain-containing protein [bacterium]|nr:DUF4390 domain-containing protein [bacterium]
MKKGLITILICALISISIASEAMAPELVISKPMVFIKDKSLATSFKIQNLLSEKEMKTINSGFTTTIRIKVELWEKGRLFHNRQTTLEIIQEVSYDIWEKIYRLRLKGNTVEFNNPKDLKETLARQETALIIPVQKLDGKKKYFVRVYVDVESINKKEMEEISARINGDSQGFINIREIFAVLVKHQSKGIKSYTQSDYFGPDRLNRY